MLKDKVAVVTGAGGGIGKAIAVMMAAQGAKVVVNDVGAGLYGQQESEERPAQEVVNLIKQQGGEAGQPAPPHLRPRRLRRRAESPAPAR